MLAPTHAEPGCKLYELYESDSKGRFYLDKAWENQAALDQHVATPHFKRLEQTGGELVKESFERKKDSYRRRRGVTSQGPKAESGLNPCPSLAAEPASVSRQRHWTLCRIGILRRIGAYTFWVMMFIHRRLVRLAPRTRVRQSTFRKARSRYDQAKYPLVRQPAPSAQKMRPVRSGAGSVSYVLVIVCLLSELYLNGLEQVVVDNGRLFPPQDLTLEGNLRDSAYLRDRDGQSQH
jgi:hypothetical protein